MTTLYLDRRNMALKIRQGTLAVYRDQRQQTTIPLKLLERIIARSDVALSGSLLAELGSRGIGLTLISGRKGEKVAHVIGHLHNDATRRLAQYRAYHNTQARLELARRTVMAKLANQQRFVQALIRQRPDQRMALTKAQKGIAKIRKELQTTTNLDTLRGQEGAAAAAYFSAYQSVLPPRLEFSGRNRRPPKDPVNATLSLSYTLAHGDAVNAAHLAGLDPAIGMLHDLAWGRPSLASDLIEPLRPYIDKWVWGLFRDRILDHEHFSYEGEACLLKKNGRQRYYGLWEARARALRRWLRLTARNLVHQIEQE